MINKWQFMNITFLTVIPIMLSIITLLYSDAFGTQPNSTNKFTDDWSKDLKSKISNLMSEALNDTENLVNSSILLSNNSNLSSNQFVISNNKVISVMNTTDSGTNSLTKDKVTTINGVCNSEKVGGAGNDTLLSSGYCNDQLTGGPGADKFQCGEGNDIIKDYNPKEGDVILDQQDCEKTE